MFLRVSRGSYVSKFLKSKWHKGVTLQWKRAANLTSAWSFDKVDGEQNMCPFYAHLKVALFDDFIGVVFGPWHHPCIEGITKDGLIIGLRWGNNRAAIWSPT